jgi:hypothetical protein
MRINELIVESQQIDELSLAGVGRGIGKAANMAGKAVGGAVGGTVAAAKQFGSGVKQGYQGASNTVGGVQPATTAPTQQTPTTQQTAQGATTPATTAPTQQTAQGAPTATAPTQPAPAASPTQLKSPPVAPGGLDGIKKAYSILDPNEKEQLKKDLEVIDDQDRLASGTNESRRVGMKSNFLGIDL